MDTLSQQDIVLRITAEDVEKASEAERSPEPIKRGIGYLESLLTSLGYEDVHSVLIEHPRKTERGTLYAEGDFAGPSPNDGEDRDPWDFSDDYRFIVVKDENYEDLWIIEAYYSTRRLAEYEITDSGLKLLDGEIEHI